ncbi:IS3 family transposase [Stenotrophomonas sp. NPDC087984]
MSEVYQFIAAEKAVYPVTLLCRVLGVVRSSFYAWLEAEQDRRARERADEALAHEITLIHLASNGAYGVPRVHAELRRLGRAVNRKRVERIMRERRITGVTRRRRRSLTRPDRQARPAPDLIGRDFTAARPGTRLVGDITYLPTREGRLYLARWLDLATREVVGYAMADHHRAELVVDALRMAHGRGSLEPGCITHSDRGSEYTSTQFRAEIHELELRQSTGRTGSCFDNAAAESFWAVLKEEIGTRIWPDRATARADVFAFIETFYNRRRLRKHPVFGYLTPLETRQRFRNDQILAA